MQRKQIIVITSLPSNKRMLINKIRITLLYIEEYVNFVLLSWLFHAALHVMCGVTGHATSLWSSVTWIVTRHSRMETGGGRIVRPPPLHSHAKIVLGTFVQPAVKVICSYIFSGVSGYSRSRSQELCAIIIIIFFITRFIYLNVIGGEENMCSTLHQSS